MKKIKTDPNSVLQEYRAGTDYKNSIGDKGIYEQAKINERFYVGDHWHGCQCGNDRPLVRRNITKRIMDYKFATISAADAVVNFSAEGVARNTVSQEEYKNAYNEVLTGAADFAGPVDNLEVSMIMDILTSYGQSTIERLKFNAKARDALKNAGTSGTGLLYSYWDELIETGLYADESKNNPIKGDINCEVLDVENVVFGDPNLDDVQSQPYIIISQRRDCEDVRREARRNKIASEEIEKIVPDNSEYAKYNAGTRGENEPSNSQRVTVYTKFYKEWDKEGKQYVIKCVRTTEKAVVRRPWNIGIRLYPISKISWDKRRSCVYGDSEITYLVPNQIAINRALSAQVYAMMMSGMPIMLVDGDIVTNDISNDPGQVIKVYGAAGDVAGAVRYVHPPSFAGQMMNSTDNLAGNTLSDSGANDAALGNLRPDNASAIIQMREAALQPLQLKQNQYYEFIEDTMRIWAEFWLNLYGDRMLKIDTPDGVAYVPFHAKRYSKLLVNARVDIGASTLYSVAVIISSLDSLRANGIINDIQYLERMPENVIPNKMGLLNEKKEELAAQQQTTSPNQPGVANEEILQMWAQQNPEAYAEFQKLPPEQQQAMLQKVIQSVNQNGGM